MNKLKQEIVHHLSPNGVPLTLVFFDNNLNNLMQLYYKHNKVKTYPESFGLSNGKIVTAHIESKNKLSVFSSNIVSAATSKFLISIDRSIVKSMSGIVCLIDDLARTGESLEMLKSLIEKNNNKCTIFTAAIITSPMAQSVNFSGQEIEGLKRDFYFSWRKKTQK
ncbi:MAG: hypothetical protein FWD76_05040 [Firmicutes bacterium]|nr:hypothetical protein [Bacillota bacterium]